MDEPILMALIKPRYWPASKLFRARWLPWAMVIALAGCAIDPGIKQEPSTGKIVCDSYIILDMCVRDLVGDGTVDMIYFTDTNEIFMYREGMKEAAGEIMSFHQCAVPLSPGMQLTTNRILNRANLSLTEELSITRALIANYMAEKPQIDACNARFEAANTGRNASQEEFFIDDEWGE